MVLVCLAIWLVFCLRDYCLITSAEEPFSQRLLGYSALQFAVAIATSFGIIFLGLPRLLSVVFSPAFLALAIALHALSAMLCFRLASTNNLALAWLPSLLPVPAGWLAKLAVLSRISSPTHPAILLLSLTALWLLLLLIRLRCRRPGLPTSQDTLFAIHFATWVNCLVLPLLPLMRR